MYDTWHWANQMMLMLIWHTVLLIVSGSKVKKADAPKMPTLWQHCCYLPCLWPANCRRFRNAAEVAARRFQPKKNNMQQTFWNARIEEFDTGFLKDWKGFSDRSPGINPASRFFFGSWKFAATVFFLGAENREQPRWQDLEDISLQISGAQCQLATCMDSTSPSTVRSSCLLSLWDDQLLGEIWKRGIFIAGIYIKSDENSRSLEVDLLQNQSNNPLSW